MLLFLKVSLILKSHQQISSWLSVVTPYCNSVKIRNCSSKTIVTGPYIWLLFASYLSKIKTIKNSKTQTRIPLHRIHLFKKVIAMVARSAQYQNKFDSLQQTLTGGTALQTKIEYILCFIKIIITFF